MSAKLDAQFEAQRGGVDIENPMQHLSKQDNAGGLSVEDFEQEREEGWGQDDDMELSR